MTPINSEDKPTNSDYAALWQLQDIEETIQDASPEEMPELYNKLEALSSGLTEAIQKLITTIQRQHERELVEAKKNGFYMACGLTGVDESRVEELWDKCIAQLTTNQEGENQ